MEAIYIQTGTRTTLGTDWPIENKVAKTRSGRWEVTYGICNGAASGSETFRTKREALAAAGITPPRP